MLQDLAAGIPRDGVDQLEAFRHRLDTQPLPVQELLHLAEAEAFLAFLHGHDRAAALARRRVGQADDRHVGHLGVEVQQILHLLGADVLSLADDDVLQAAGDGDIALRVDDPEVTRAEEAVLVEGAGVERGVEVALHHLGSPGPQLALLAGAGDPALQGHHAELDPRHRPSLRAGQLLVRVVVASHGEDR